MKRTLLFTLTQLILQIVFSQQPGQIDKNIQSISVQDSIRKYFNYDTLKNIACDQVPVGIYAVTFKINQKGHVSDISFSHDSLSVLKILFTDALLKAAKQAPIPYSKHKYLQLIYFKNVLACVTPNDTNFVDDNKIVLQVAHMLNDYLSNIETSFASLFKPAKSPIMILPTVIIDDENPNRKKPGGSFRNDYRKSNNK